MGIRLLRLDYGQVLLGFTLDEDGRIDRELERLTRSGGYKPGELQNLKSALETKVPRNAFVLVRSGPAREKRKAIIRLGLLAFPRQFDELPDSALGSVDAGRIDSHVFILDLEPLEARAFETWFDLIGETPSWRLWQGKERTQ